MTLGSQKTSLQWLDNGGQARCVWSPGAGAGASPERPPVELMSYDVALDAPLDEAPRPFVHPLRTLSGQLVSDLRPPDHRWHHGLSLTCADLSGFNFWGGPTYERGRGYVALPNHGRQVPGALQCDALVLAPPSSALPSEIAHLSHDLHWVAGGRTLLHERRSLAAAVLPSPPPLNRAPAAGGAWLLRWTSKLRNVSGQTLRWGSPTTNGRPNAGYGGLFWRGPASFHGQPVLFPAQALNEPQSTNDSAGFTVARSDEAMMGARTPWILARSAPPGEKDGAPRVTHPPNDAQGAGPAILCGSHRDGPAMRWFARNSTPMLAWAFCFDEVLEQSDKETLRLDHWACIFDRAPAPPSIPSWVAHCRSALKHMDEVPPPLRAS
jgi:hypothetical protein